MLTGKTALITGCRRGIGKDILELFAQNGSSIIACVRRYSADFVDYINSLRSMYGVKIEIIYVDLADETAIKDIMLNLFKSKTQIDILVNNAGIAFGGLLQMTSMTKLKEVFQINFFSQVLLTQYITKLMIRNKRGGSIINMGSIAGLDNFAGYTAYGSSKSALMFFTKTIAKELAQYKIRVNAIAPGLIDTEMASLMESSSEQEMLTRTAMNRLGQGSEVAKLALFLATQNSSFITGQVIRIDGGM